MSSLPLSLQRAINEFAKLPGIGQKSAQKLAFFLLKKSPAEIENFSATIQKLKDGVLYCSNCNIMADSTTCNVCSDNTRDASLLCVVEESMDALALDSSGQFRGKFHILGGVLNPMEGIGPDSLFIQHLLDRLGLESSITEVIIATNPSLEGETTAMHLSKLIKQQYPDLKLTRIARGLPMGGDLEYTDQITLTRALEGRREY
jgi:recombination protein RecR